MLDDGSRLCLLVVIGLLLITVGLAGCLGDGEELSGSEIDPSTQPGAAPSGHPTPPNSNTTPASDNPSGGGTNASNTTGTPDSPTNQTRSSLLGEGPFSSTHVFEGDYQTNASLSRTLENGPHEIGETRAVYLESDVDGKAIEVAYVRPDVPEGVEVPIIVVAGPYMNPLHEANLTEVYGFLSENFVDHGYAIGFVPVRGTGDSGGCARLLGPVERADVSQAVTWLATRNWSNGRVAMTGGSYPGSTPWGVAALGNPHLETIVPLEGVNDFYSLMYPNGTKEPRSLFIHSLYHTRWGFAEHNPTNGRSAPHTLDAIVCPEVARGVAAGGSSAVTGQRDPTGFWAERNTRPMVEENYDGSVFLVHGLQDWNVDPSQVLPWVRDELDHEQNLTIKYLLGQWGHSYPDGENLDQPTRRVDYHEILLHWFDYWLKGNTSRDLGPKVQVEDSTGQWRSADRWPADETAPIRLHLAPGGNLSRAADTPHGTVTVHPDTTLTRGEPRIIDNGGGALDENDVTCTGCQIFATKQLEDPLRFGGLPTLHVQVTPTAPKGYLAAFLYARTPAGESSIYDGAAYRRVGWTSMDLQHADADGEPEPVVPGETITARMQFHPLDTVVPEHDEIVLILAQGGQDHHRLEASGPIQVHVGGDRSTLTLDAFTITPGQTFESPGERPGALVE